ncbi:MAG: dolichol-phosphate mannosyltransferase [Hyphomicrobiales bacterium]|nr:dolichol-phosphate mannosyltransferase [Hyphomicrobiales bacterium]
MPPATPELSIVVPVVRADDIDGIVEKLRGALSDADWQVVFVDDNVADDGPLRAAVAGDERVRGLRRVGRNGLTQTCLVAMLASGARYVAMLEPGFDVHRLPAMLAPLRRGEADLVVATRRHAGGGAFRRIIRAGLSAITRRALSTEMSDPASGVFMMRRDALETLTPSLSPLGHQVLLDLIATARGRLRIVEIAGDDDRQGAHKSELKLALELLALMLAKLSGDAVSIRFVLFCLVGLSGVGIHLAVLDAALLALPFTAAQTVATIGAMIWNFTLNNAVTYGDQRLTGWAYLTGLVRFMIICGIGAVSNVGVATFIYAHDNTWWIAGLGGAVMGAVWNYAVSSVFVWRPR